MMAQKLNCNIYKIFYHQCDYGYISGQGIKTNIVLIFSKLIAKLIWYYLIFQ